MNKKNSKLPFGFGHCWGQKIRVNGRVVEITPETVFGYVSATTSHGKKEDDLATRALRPRKEPFIALDHPQAEVFSRVLGPGILK